MTPSKSNPNNSSTPDTNVPPNNSSTNNIDDDDEEENNYETHTTTKTFLTPTINPLSPSTTLPPSTIENKNRDNNFIKDVILAHNALRSIHGAKALTENEELTKKAQELAEEFASNDSEKQSIDLDFGENIERECFDEDGKYLNADDAVLQCWAKGFCDQGDIFSKKVKPLSPGTQVVWSKSTEAGVGKKNFKNEEGKSCSIVVMLYSPKGNVENEVDDNVKKGDFDYDTMCNDIKNTLVVAKEMLENEQGDNTTANFPTQENSSEDNKENAVNGNGSKGQSQEAFAKDALDAHNTLRKIHNSPPMILDDDLNRAAAEYAKKLAELGRLEHASPNERDNAGENLAYSCSSGEMPYPASDPVGAWYSEVCSPGYSFGSNTFSSGTGHFTQVVWKGSTKLGMGFAIGNKDGMTCYYAVGRYKEAGNMLGEYQTNVEKGSFDKSSICKGDAVDEKIFGTGGPSSPQDTLENGEANQAKEDNEKGELGNGKNGGKDQSQKDFSKDALEAHNILRKIHDSPAMTLDDSLNRAAAEYAQKLARLGKLEHASSKDRDGAGENLAYSCSSGPTSYPASDPVGAWYSEVCSPGYSFGSNTFSSGTGHFTQVVWKGSTKLGMGFAIGNKDGMTCYYAVGRYKEAGNMGGEFETNVQKGTFNKATICKGNEINPNILNAGFVSKRQFVHNDQIRSIGTSLFNNKEEKERKVSMIQKQFIKKDHNQKLINKGLLKKAYIPEGERRWLQMMRSSHHRHHRQ